MNDKVERQLAILSELIDTYRAGHLPLNTLVQRIEATANFIDISWWKDELFPILLLLEQINAAALDNRSALSESDRADIIFALNNLDLLVKRIRKA